MQEKIEKVIEEIRPLLQADGGDVEFVDYIDGVVRVKLKGACHGCPGAIYTLKNGIEQRIKTVVPEVKSVEAV